MVSKGKPDVFRYTDYRVYLKDLFTYMQQQDGSFTYRSFSQKAGYASPSIFKEIVDGKKGIPAKSFTRFTAPFKLNKKELKYLEALVLFNQAKSDGSKSRYFREIIRLQKDPRSKNIRPEQYEFYSTWYNAVIRELAALHDFNPNPEWIAQRISPQVSPAQVKKALDLLLELGMLKKDGKNGRLVQDVPKLTIGPDISIQAVKELARRSLEMEWEAIERFAPEDREISGLTMHMSESCYRDVKDMVRKFKQEVLDYVSRHPEASDTVCQLNLGLFPYTSNLQKANKR